MQTQNTSNTTATPTLAELLAARAEERTAAAEREELQQRADRQNERRSTIERMEQWVAAHLSPALAEALDASADCDMARLDDPANDHIAGYVALTLYDADRAGQLWKITREWYIWGEESCYVLRGPDGYNAQLPNTYRDENLDAAILDAIAAYPAWLADAEQRAEEERQKRAETDLQEQKAKHSQPYHVTRVNGPLGMLRQGAHLHLLTTSTSGGSGIMEWQATLDDSDDCWLLLTLDGSGAQLLVPVARVLYIKPLPHLAPDAE